MQVAKGVLATILGLVLLVALSIGAWQLDWFVKEKNVDRQVQLDNRNVGTQVAWRDEVLKTIADYEIIDPANTAARGALRTKACELIGRLRPDYVSPAIETFNIVECGA